MDKIRDKFDSSNIKKIIKAGTLLIGLVLIIFISFFNATFDFENINWYEWLANSSILVGIMIFGILMGESTGTDIQQDKVNGRFQTACSEYKDIVLQVECIKVYFSQFWLWYKERKLIEKKIDYLIDNQFDGRVARIIVNNIDKEDLESGKLLYNVNEPTNKIYVKNGVKIKKLNDEQIDIVRKIYSFKLDTYGEGYYLSLFDDTESKVNDVEKGKKITEKINRDKRRSFGLKITSSLIISIVWGALTIYELTGGGDSAVKKAWMNLLSRVCALITSFFSGYSTSVINVRDKASAIENKVDIIKTFKSSYDNKLFVPETYEEMIEREFKEQELAESEEVVEEDSKL